MRIHLLIILTLGILAGVSAQAAPQVAHTTLQRQLENTFHSFTQVQHVFGTLEAVWQFKTQPRKHKVRLHTTYTRTHTQAVKSEEWVFFRPNWTFKPGGFAKQLTLVELTFTALDGTKITLEPAYYPLQKNWAFTHVQKTVH